MISLQRRCKQRHLNQVFSIKGLTFEKKTRSPIYEVAQKKVRHKTFGVQFIYGASGSFFMLF